MKRRILILLVAAIILFGAAAGEDNVPPAMPQGVNGEPETPPDGMGTPPDGMGTPPDGMGTPPDGMRTPSDGMGTPPDGMEPPPDGMGMPGGPVGAPETYDAVSSYANDTEICGETISSEGKDENAILVTDGSINVSDSTITRTSADSTGGDQASFYGIGAAVLTTGGTVSVDGTTIETDAAGGAGVFAYGEGIANVSNTAITTKQACSGGIHVAGGGTLYAKDLTVTTYGGSAAAIRSDKGGGTMTVEGGSYTAYGSGSPAVYVTADISITDAELKAVRSEALCLEGKNSVRLVNCELSGDMPDQEQNDNTWTVILYQSMSGDAETGEGSFFMEGGSLISENGGIFYTTNTDSVFTLKNVEIFASDNCEYLLRCTGNANARGWGKSGANGANCVFNAIGQLLPGDVLYDSISNLTLNLSEGSMLTGAVLDDESFVGEGGDGTCRVVIDKTSQWIVTGDSVVGTVDNSGSIVDANGLTVTVMGEDGTVFVRGESPFTVTANEYIEK